MAGILVLNVYEEMNEWPVEESVAVPSIRTRVWKEN